MFTKSLVLFPNGVADGKITLPDATEMEAHRFCLVHVIQCCEQPPLFVTNPGHLINDFFPALKEREREVCSPQTQTVVVLSMSQPITAIFGARRQLQGKYKVLEDAMWIVYVGTFIASFRGTALRLGTIDGAMDAFPTWATREYGSFSILTPQLADPGYLQIGARRYWRNLAPQMHSTSRSGSLRRLSAAQSSGSSSSSFPATIPPADPSIKKP